MAVDEVVDPHPVHGQASTFSSVANSPFEASHLEAACLSMALPPTIQLSRPDGGHVHIHPPAPELGLAKLTRHAVPSACQVRLKTPSAIVRPDRQAWRASR